MDVLRCGISVPFEYPVLFTDGVFARENPALAQTVGGAKALVFVEETLASAQPGLVADVEAAGLNLLRKAVVLPGGEAAKRTTAVFDESVKQLEAARVDRHAYAIIVGGGAFLDAVGFAATVVHRGIRQIRVPTTVLAQNDAGIGVKNGIDAFGKKNFLGTFNPPAAVINDYGLLRTLPDAVFRDGFAEAVKVGLIRDRGFFEWLEANATGLVAREETACRWLIRRCAELHLAQISGGGDPFERGSARPLDFGHWSAHRLEQLSDFTVSHGQAVAIGMLLDSVYAERVGLAKVGTAVRVRAVLEAMRFSTTLPAVAEAVTLLSGLEEFREHLGGELCITLLREAGTAVEVGEIDLAVMRESIQSMLAT